MTTIATSRTYFKTEGHRANYLRKIERRAVNSGRASWAFLRPAVSPEMPSGPPVAPVRQPLPRSRRIFGEGLGERHPIHRLPVSLSDVEWWDQQCREAESRELEQRYGEFIAQGRLECSGVI